MSFEAKKRRRLLRGVRRAAGPELAAVLRGEGWAPAPVADEDLERLWRRAKLGADLGEEIAALDAARRLRPRDKGHEFFEAFRLPPGSSTIRILDDSPLEFREHRIVKGVTNDERAKQWIREGMVAHVSIGDRVVSSAHACSADSGPEHGSRSE